jgi:hypothetical protein
MLIVRVVKFIVFALAWCWRGAGVVLADMQDIQACTLFGIWKI